MTVPFPFFKGNLFVLAVIGTHFCNSFRSLLSHGGSSFWIIKFHIYLIQSTFDLISRGLTAPIDPLIILSDTFLLSNNITLAPAQNFTSAGNLSVRDRLMLSGTAMEHVFVSISSFTILSFKKQFQNLV